KLPSARFHKPQLIKAVLVTFGVIAAFFAGVPVAMAAFLGGALLLITRAIKAHKVYQEIDGSLLLSSPACSSSSRQRRRSCCQPSWSAPCRIFILPIATCSPPTPLCSPISSAMCPRCWRSMPFLLGLADQHRIWLVIAMSTTLAGNLTPVGSIANLIVAERARAAGIHISLWTYCRAGIPIAVITLALGAWWLSCFEVANA